jgi:hypothetical protein
VYALRRTAERTGQLTREGSTELPNERYFLVRFLLPSFFWSCFHWITTLFGGLFRQEA